MTMNVTIVSDDTAQAVGIRYILEQFFDITAEISDRAGFKPADSDQSTLYIVSAARWCENQDFFIPRRNRTITLGNGEKQLDTTACESDIIDQLRNLLKDHSPKKSETSAELTPREIDVLRLAAAGLINKEIAERLNISFNTVLSHRKNISAKLGIKSVSGLSVYAMMNGYL